MSMTIVPKAVIRRDPRFTLEENWERSIVPNIKEAQARGVLVTPLTVFAQNGEIIGWQLYGWVAPPGKILYKCKPFDELVLDYSI